MEFPNVAQVLDRHRYVGGEKNVMVFGGRGHGHAGSAFVGILLLSGLMAGTLWLPKGSAFSRGLMNNGRPAHQPGQASESARQPSADGPRASADTQGTPDPAGAPAEMLGRKASPFDKSATSRHLEALHPHSGSVAKTRPSIVEATSQRANRSGLYAVLLLLLANGQH